MANLLPSPTVKELEKLVNICQSVHTQVLTVGLGVIFVFCIFHNYGSATLFAFGLFVVYTHYMEYCVLFSLAGDCL